MKSNLEVKEIIENVYFIGPKLTPQLELEIKSTLFIAGPGQESIKK